MSDTVTSMSAVLPGEPVEAGSPGASADPVFVLCAGRSGSTLLRFLLDAHPDLACPPETNVPALCGQLATVWSLIEGAPLSANRGDEPPDIPDAAIAGVRETMDRMTGSYLARRGKKRYCDKSLGTARFSFLMTRIWPETKFICLFRHPMDVIASGIEACPWGLNGYGFDPYIAETPGNAVFALARFWFDNASVIKAAEEQYADRCHRVRYEDMVADPQETADRLFEFLGAAPVPDIASRMFAGERERYGPADYKIWHTSRITSDSVGRGWTLPAGMIGPQVRAAINELCGKLGYLPVDDNWGTADQPADLRVPIIEETTAEAAGEAEAQPDTEAGERGAVVGTATAGPEAVAELPEPEVPTAEVPKKPKVPRPELSAPEWAAAIGDRLAAGVSRLQAEDFAGRWEPCAQESFELIATAPPVSGASAVGPSARWLIDLTARTLTVLDGTPASVDAEDEDDDDDDDSSWDVVASLDTWQQVLDGKLNMSVALRRHLIRYYDTGDAGPVHTEARLGMLGDLLGLASWGQARQRADQPAAQT